MRLNPGIQLHQPTRNQNSVTVAREPTEYRSTSASIRDDTRAAPPADRAWDSTAGGFGGVVNTGSVYVGFQGGISDAGSGPQERGSGCRGGAERCQKAEAAKNLAASLAMLWGFNAPGGASRRQVSYTWNWRKKLSRSLALNAWSVRR
jgi:hypothetical protein